MNKEQTSPNEVKIITEVKTLYRADGQKAYFLNENDARNSVANADKCEICGGYSQKFFTICDNCREQKEREKHAQKLIDAPEWDGEYPVCLGDNFFFDEEEFFEHVVENDIHPDDIDDLYSCTPIYAKDTIDKSDLIERVTENMGGEEPECPAKIESAIDEFIAKLETMKEPISWVGDKLVRITTEQIMAISKELQSNKE